MPGKNIYELKMLEAEKLVRDMALTDLPIDPMAIAEEEGIEVKAIPEAKAGVSGMLIKSGDAFGIAYATYVENEGFQRFSVAHELGHYFLAGHMDHLIPVGDGIHESHAGFSSNEWFEKEADHFAAGLLMPRPMFTRTMSSSGYGLDAVEYLADKFMTSRTATAIHYSQLADIPTAIVISSGKTIDYAFMSESLEDMKGLDWIKKGSLLPNASLTTAFNMDSSNVSDCERNDGTCSIQDWFGGKRDIGLTEEVRGLGGYGKSLTVLTIEDGFDEDELEADEEMEESWTPRFR